MLLAAETAESGGTHRSPIYMSKWWPHSLYKNQSESAPTFSIWHIMHMLSNACYLRNKKEKSKHFGDFKIPWLLFITRRVANPLDFHRYNYIHTYYHKFLQFDWLRAVVFQLNLKYLYVKITNLLWVVVWTNNSMIFTWYLAEIPLAIFQNYLSV